MTNMTYSNYRGGDFLIRIKNSAMAKNPEVSVTATKFIVAIAECLKEEGFLQAVEVKDGVLTVHLSYSHKNPVLTDLTLVSKPGLRVYTSKDEIAARKARSSILILSTPKGIMSGRKAVKTNLGGEVIAEIW